MLIIPYSIPLTVYNEGSNAAFLATLSDFSGRSGDSITPFLFYTFFFDFEGFELPPTMRNFDFKILFEKNSKNKAFVGATLSVWKEAMFIFPSQMQTLLTNYFRSQNVWNNT